MLFLPEGVGSVMRGTPRSRNFKAVILNPLKFACGRKKRSNLNTGFPKRSTMCLLRRRSSYLRMSVNLFLRLDLYIE